MTERLFTKDELEWLALSGAERVRRTLARGDAPRTREEFAKVIGLYRQFHDLYHGWTSSLFAHLSATYGHEFTKASTHLEHTLARKKETPAWPQATVNRTSRRTSAWVTASQ